MGSFAKKFAAVFAVVLLLETVNASNLKWVKACGGGVPDYAVVGGENFSGEVLYVARVRLPAGLTTGKMAPSYKVAHTSYAGKEIYKSDYEILTNPGWKSHLEWRKSSGRVAPENAVNGGSDRGTPLYVARVKYVDGHMIPSKASYRHREAHYGYNNKEFRSLEWDVLIEHPRWYVKRGMLLKRRDFPELPGVASRERVYGFPKL